MNVLIALASENHIHYPLVWAWFTSVPGLHWAVCAFTEAGFLRNATAARPGQISMGEAVAVLQNLTQHPGYRYQPITADWQTLVNPFSARLYGTKQVTDAYLLGLAIKHELILITMDKALMHLAGPEHRKQVMLLQAGDSASMS